MTTAQAVTIRVLVVDDHPIVRAGLSSVLSAQAGIVVVGQVGNGEEACELAAIVQPQVVLCDLRLGEGISGVEVTERLRQFVPPPTVLILTTFDRDAEILAAIEAGAAGYLLKDAPPETIVSAIRTVAAGHIFLPPELSARVVRGIRTPLPRLTQREIEVLKLVDTGASNKEIARALFVSEATVKSHLVHIFTKLGVDSRAKAVHRARTTGLI